MHFDIVLGSQFLQERLRGSLRHLRLLLQHSDCGNPALLHSFRTSPMDSHYLLSDFVNRVLDCDVLARLVDELGRLEETDCHWIRCRVLTHILLDDSSLLLQACSGRLNES